MATQTETSRPAGRRSQQHSDLPDEAALRGIARRGVLSQRHPGRWIASAVVLVIVAQIIHGLATNQIFQWSVWRHWFLNAAVLDGLEITLKATLYSAVLGLIGGIVLALGRLSHNPLLRAVSWTYIWLFRSIPLLVVLLLAYNFGSLYPHISIGIPFGPSWGHFKETNLATDMVIGVIGLSLNEAAYAAEVVRSGILSVDQGQHEAALALGLPKSRQFRRIVLPQALRTIVPSYVNQLIGLLKSTSLLYYVSLLDLFGVVQNLGSTYPSEIIPTLLVATAWYVALTSVLSVVQYYVERYYSRGALRTLPPTPLQRLRRLISDRPAGPGVVPAANLDGNQNTGII